MSNFRSHGRRASRNYRDLLAKIPSGYAALLWPCALTLAIAFPAHSATASQETPIPPPAIAARAWAVDCADNEVLVIQHPDSYLRYRLHVVDDKGDQIRDQIETPDGSVARLIERDGRALTPDEDSAERQRLNDLAASPSTFARHISREQENRNRGVALLRMMPDAMLWSYAPGNPRFAAQPVGEPDLVVLDFKPNSSWSPPSMEAEPLTGLEGRVWIDPRTKRMVHLEGNIFHTVNIGWGVLARIYPGGTVTLQQTQVGGQRWIVDHIVEQLTVRALMVRNFKQRLVYDTTDFRPVAPMSYQQAIKILLDTPLPSH